MHNRVVDREPQTDPPSAPAGVLPPPVTVGEGRSAVQLALAAQGRDLIVTITGGEAHVGAVAVVSVPAPATAAPHCSLSVVPGHAEGPLAEEAAARIAAATGKTCVAVAGIHQDQATRAEIAAIVENVKQGLSRLEEDLVRQSAEPRRARAHPGPQSKPGDTT